ncbi:competence/damage-inducible protein A [Exilibacterium tricleocarpae]|uniref:Competence/damage-inducible protein A n=1 Tax=Exilibacterium tricleocarpae TaxID=2591008 RepID=A0A545TYW6_9GAMM|nr:molybdopterin-binding protein [Exilibacterium tricleocarpae]TQV82401.1 competence/damage-inducible protein A [Exilibacterium tricleocarpae]
MHIGLIIVGDEILSGRRQDRHFTKVVEILRSRGLVLDWVRILGDDGPLLTQALHATFATPDLVFSTGGIGATPDDLTRAAAAAALDIDLAVHPEGLELVTALARKRGVALQDHHRRMVEFPKGAALIPNPVNNVPGFSVGHHHFVPGFPEMAWPMIEWVLDHLYPELNDRQYLEQALMVEGQYEGVLTPLLQAVTTRHPQVKVFCLPSMQGDLPSNEVGIKGSAAQVKLAMAELKSQLDEHLYAWRRLD